MSELEDMPEEDDGFKIVTTKGKQSKSVMFKDEAAAETPKTPVVTR